MLLNFTDLLKIILTIIKHVLFFSPVISINFPFSSNTFVFFNPSSSHAAHKIKNLLYSLLKKRIFCCFLVSSSTRSIFLFPFNEFLFLTLLYLYSIKNKIITTPYFKVLENPISNIVVKINISQLTSCIRRVFFTPSICLPHLIICGKTFPVKINEGGKKFFLFIY